LIYHQPFYSPLPLKDDGVNVFKAITRDPRFVAGAGATEIELGRKIHAQGEASPGLDQYAIKKFAESLEVRSPFHDF